MLKPAASRFISAALLSAFVGLTGCHISFSSGSSSKSPNSTKQAKPAKKSPSKPRPAGTTSKPISSKSASTKPVDEPAPAPTKTVDEGPKRDEADKKVDEGPKRDEADKKAYAGPKRTKPTSDPKRVEPADTTSSRKLGTRKAGDDPDTTTTTPSSPGNLKAPQ